MASGDFPKGQDVAPKERFTSTAGQEFQKQSEVKQMTAAEIVGVQQAELQSKQPISLSTQNAFWGIDCDENTKKADEMFQKKEAKKEYDFPMKNQTNAFYGVEDKEYGIVPLFSF